MIRLAAIAVALCSLAGAAQELELDLSEPVEKVPEEYRPQLVIGGVRAKGPADDAVTAARAQQLEQELVRIVNEGEQFKTVIEPRAAATQAGAAGDPKSCADWACFEKIVKALKSERMIVAEVEKSGAGSVVTVSLYDPGFSELMVVSQDSGEKAERAFAGMGGKPQAQKDKEFLKKMTPFLTTALSKLATPNGKILVDNVDPTAAVTIDGAPAGVGTFDTIVPRGSHTVKVAVAGYLPFEQRVTVEPKTAVPVKVMLVAKPVEVPKLVKVEERTGPAFYTRPGLYVAAAGVAAVCVGLAMGAGAKATEARVGEVDENGISPVTRAQAKQATSQATIATALMAGGAAVAAGGAVWFFITPTTAPAAAKKPAPDTEGGGFGVMVGASGVF